MPRIYVSPSSQERNVGVTPFGTEEKQMNLIADSVVWLLAADKRFTVDRNNPSMDVGQMATASNAFKADLHLAIHSNAGGGVGTEVYAYAPGTASEKLARCLYNQVAPLSPGADRGVKYDKNLYEVGDHVKATSALIELGFHDNAADAAWLAGQPQQIAIALYKGLCDFYPYDYRALVVTPPVAPIVAPAAVKGPIAPDDIYLTVRVRESLSAQAIKDINKLGFACQKLELA